MSNVYLERISELENSLKVHIEKFSKESEIKSDETLGFISALSGLTEVVRDAQTAGCDGLEDLVEKVDIIIQRAVADATDPYDEEGPFSGGDGYTIPSFAHQQHNAPLLKDESKRGQFSPLTLKMMLDIFATIPRRNNKGSVQAGSVAIPDELKPPEPWNTTRRPHSNSTRCARFQDTTPGWQPTEVDEQATAVLEARCEVTSGDIANPIDLVISSGGKYLALSSMGGWKDRTPFVHYYRPSAPNHSDETFMEEHSIKTDLSSVLTDLLLDEERDLVFVADSDRIKSYHLEKQMQKSRGRSTVLPVHTIDSEEYTGPMAIHDGRILRAGNGQVAVWDLNTLPTHGSSGGDVIGERMDIDDMDTMRDDADEIEPSSGTTSITTTIKLGGNAGGAGEEAPMISVWHPLPSNPNAMLCAFKADGPSDSAYCHTYDLQAGGKLCSRYLGHGASIIGFSSSARADPNTFLTWCHDGYARLYDTRHPLPVLTIEGSKGADPLTAAAFACPNGVPFVFTATSRTEDIVLWDVRSRALVYQLATGNNTVESLLWDDSCNTLYAASMCPYVDRLGNNVDYRAAKIPRTHDSTSAAAGGSESDEEEWEDDDDDDDPEFAWPKKANHGEDYFGHVFDAGGHRLYKFEFKTDPRPNIVPHYGDATIYSGGW